MSENSFERDEQNFKNDDDHYFDTDRPQQHQVKLVSRIRRDTKMKKVMKSEHTID